MRPMEPRLTPVPEPEWSAEQREVMQPFAAQGSIFNVFTTLLHHPDLLRRWLVFARHVLGKSTLTLHDRELLILRVAHRCDSPYEWAQHTAIAKRAGMSEDDIDSATAAADNPKLTDKSRLLLRAADELLDDTCLSDDTWRALARHYDAQQLLDIVFTVGQYKMLAMALNSLGVQVDEGL